MLTFPDEIFIDYDSLLSTRLITFVMVNSHTF